MLIDNHLSLQISILLLIYLGVADADHSFLLCQLQFVFICSRCLIQLTTRVAKLRAISESAVRPSMIDSVDRVRRMAVEDSLACLLSWTLKTLQQVCSLLPGS